MLRERGDAGESTTRMQACTGWQPVCKQKCRTRRMPPGTARAGRDLTRPRPAIGRGRPPGDVCDGHPPGVTVNFKKDSPRSDAPPERAVEPFQFAHIAGKRIARHFFQGPANSQEIGSRNRTKVSFSPPPYDDRPSHSKDRPKEHSLRFARLLAPAAGPAGPPRPVPLRGTASRDSGRFRHLPAIRSNDAPRGFSDSCPPR